MGWASRTTRRTVTNDEGHEEREFVLHKMSTRPARSKGLSDERLAEMIEEATVDAYGPSEQVSGFDTMLEEHLDCPFTTKVLGVEVTVERVDLTGREEIVAICTRGRERQSIPILELHIPKPAPEGAEWIEAYRHWTGGG